MCAKCWDWKKANKTLQIDLKYQQVILGVGVAQW